jgi:hypothetical protein
VAWFVTEVSDSALDTIELGSLTVFTVMVVMVVVAVVMVTFRSFVSSRGEEGGLHQKSL